MKRMNKIAASLLAAMTAVTCSFSLPVSAAETTTVTTTTSPYVFTTTTTSNPLNADEVLTITVYEDSATVLKCDPNAEGEIIVPATVQGVPVTMIAQGAFENCTKITKVTLPDSISKIPDDCFSGCSKLESIPIPDTVVWIGMWAFRGCASIKDIVLPPQIHDMSGYVFESCSLNSLTIKNPSMGLGLSLSRLTVETIYGYPGSTAETYAKQNGIAFVALEVAPETTLTRKNTTTTKKTTTTTKKTTTTKATTFYGQKALRKFNVDGKVGVTISDVVFLARYITEDPELVVPYGSEPDVNEDGIVNVDDVMSVLHALEPFCLQIDTFTAKPGTKLTIPVKLDSDKGIAGGQVYIEYDPLLKPISITAGDAYDMYFVARHDLYPLFVSWTTKRGEDQIAADGSVLAYLEFEVDANAQPKTFLNVSIAASAGDQSTRFCDETGYTFSASYKNGNVFVN